MARRPGPGPKSPELRRRRNADPNVSPALGTDGWTEISPDAFEGDIPEVPAWVKVGPTALAFYDELARLPQAATWGPGDWLTLHASLPLLDRYFARPGSESYKAWTSVLDPGLRITSESMQKARMRVRIAQEADQTGQGTTSRSSSRNRGLVVMDGGLEAG